MIKTSTKQKNAKGQTTEASQEPDRDVLFYNSIKKELNDLVKEPGAEVLDRILTYSKKK